MSPNVRSRCSHFHISRLTNGIFALACSTEVAFYITDVWSFFFFRTQTPEDFTLYSLKKRTFYMTDVWRLHCILLKIKHSGRLPAKAQGKGYQYTLLDLRINIMHIDSLSIPNQEENRYNLELNQELYNHWRIWRN